MKKALTITARILVYCISLLLLIFVVIMALLLHPKSLHSLVQTQTEKYLICDCEIENIDLNLFNNFPQLELDIKELNLLNPFPGNSNDTLLGIKHLQAKIHLGKFISQQSLFIDTFLIDQLSLHAYIDSSGQSNFDILNLKSDPNDTTALTLPFKSIHIGHFKLLQAGIIYTDKADSILARINGLDIFLSVKHREQKSEGLLCLISPDLSLSMEGTSYLDKDSLEIKLPLCFEENKLSLDKVLLVLNQVRLQSSGSVGFQDQGLMFDLDFETEQVAIQPSLQLIPPGLASLPGGIFLDGLFELRGKINGLYNDSLMPEILLQGALENGFFSYDDPALELKDISSELELFVDLNRHQASYIKLPDVKTNTGKSSLAGSVFINDLLANDMCIDLDLFMDLDLEEIAAFLPEDMAVSLYGRAKGPGKGQFYLSQLMERNLQEMNIQADFLLQNFKGSYNDYTLETPRGRLSLTIPNNNSLTSLLNAELYQCQSLHAYMDSSLKAELQQADVYFELSDVMTTTDSIAFSGKLNAEKAFVWYDQMEADMLNPKAEMAMQMDFLDSTSVSDLFFDVEASRLYGQMDSIQLNIQNPVAKMQMQAQDQDQSSARITADYFHSALNLRYGQETILTESLGIRAEATEDTSEEQILLRWNPVLEVYLQEGDVQLSAISEKIIVPDIRFNYSNDAFNIIESRIQLGNSDFQLMGDVLNIGNYLNNKGTLKGELNFVSNLTDVNQLMKLTSGLGGSENEVKAGQETIQADKKESDRNKVAQTDSAADSGPFMVPKNIDLSLNTSIMNAYVGNQIATNLTGRLYIKDDALILEEIGFVSAAARLKLTAMYRSPRTNHLYLGLDY
ncbi:MAG: hypothetical protein PHE04_00665, partial [Bacteroidales bacterium]|nr:hypothetical protein [Bacteroidales bacterium]